MCLQRLPEPLIIRPAGRAEYFEVCSPQPYSRWKALFWYSESRLLQLSSLCTSPLADVNLADWPWCCGCVKTIFLILWTGELKQYRYKSTLTQVGCV